MVVIEPSAGIDVCGSECDVPSAGWNLEELNGVDKGEVGGMVSPYDHVQCGDRGEMVYGKDSGGSGAEDLVTFQWVVCLTTIEVLYPGKDEGDEFKDGELVCSGEMQLLEISPPCPGEQVTGDSEHICHCNHH